MENDTPPPLKPPIKPPSAKREKIIDMALKQLRKSRAKIDPGILNKIRRMIAGSPEIMKSLGVDEELHPIDEKPQNKRSQRVEAVVDGEVKTSSRDAAKAQVQKQKKIHKDMVAQSMLESKQESKQKTSKEAQPKSNLKDGEYEKVDQGKNMEVLAKLMMLNPKGKDKIKAVIKKASE